MDQILLFLTIFCVSQLIWLILFLGLHHPNNLLAKLFIALSIGLASYLVLPFSMGVWQWGKVNYLLVAMSIASPGIIWLFCHAIFYTNKTIKWWHYSIVLSYVALSMIGVITSNFIDPHNGQLLTKTQITIYFTIPQVIKLTLLGHAMFLTLRDWRDDLIAGRRQYRAVFTAICAISAMVVVTFELWSNQPLANNLLISSIFALFLLTFTLINFNFKTGFMAATLNKSDTKKSVDVSANEQKKVQTQAVVHSLKKLMTIECFYKEHGLTVTLLAKKLNIPAYILRQVINQELDYSNFNHYLNEYRINAALIQLVANETKHLPIISIALDVGFRSLSTFNKAFKEQTGKTPTQYRQNTIQN